MGSAAAIREVIRVGGNQFDRVGKAETYRKGREQEE